MRYPAGDERLFGISVPLGSIKVHGGWRVGEYPDLVPFAGLCKELGARLLQLLPLNDTGGQSSPYSALSAFALHPLYIRVRDLPEAAAAPGAVEELESFAAKATSGERFPYGACLDAKLAALRAVYKASADSIAADAGLASFESDRPWLRTYAVYRRLKSSYGEQAWRSWPDHGRPTRGEIDTLWDDPSARREQRFHAWMQYRAAEQFGAAAEAVAGMGLVLLGDIPILMNDDSADVWADRGFFDDSLRAGAPPDMYSAVGQNWGFPIYDWAAMAEDGYSFWRARVAEAARYYSAYRIDHVLGFFRIWALGDRDETGCLGRFVPGPELGADELTRSGFSEARLRWLSEPHIPGAELRVAVPATEAASVVEAALERIGDEDLFRFKRSIRGEADIGALPLGGATRDYLKDRWRDRTLLAIGGGRFAPTWSYRGTRAWASLSDGERSVLEAMLGIASASAELDWEDRGRRLLSMLGSASDMLPCAEDLGAVPDCVPRVLSELGIPGLRVPRWMRRWDEPGQPFMPLSEYGELSACTPSVHDTSTLRGWWEREDGRDAFVEAYCPELSPASALLDPECEGAVLAALAKAPSKLFVVQLQDLLDLSDRYRSDDPSDDRVNVPGNVDEFNWTWRMGPGVEELERDRAWTALVRASCGR